MSQLSEIRNVIAERVSAVVDGEMNVFAYPPKDYPLPAVLVLPTGDGPYVDYHGTFGAIRLQEVNLVVRIMVPEGGSLQTAGEVIDDVLSSGATEEHSLADAITGADITITNVGQADIYAAQAEGWATGDLQRGQTTPVVSCDIPVVVRVRRA